MRVDKLLLLLFLVGSGRGTKLGLLPLHIIFPSTTEITVKADRSWLMSVTLLVQSWNESDFRSVAVLNIDMINASLLVLRLDDHDSLFRCDWKIYLANANYLSLLFVARITNCPLIYRYLKSKWLSHPWGRSRGGERAFPC